MKKYQGVSKVGRGKAAKLTDEQAAEIRRQYEYGRKRKLILAEFHITYHALWQVVNGRAHKFSGATSAAKDGDAT